MKNLFSIIILIFLFSVSNGSAQSLSQDQNRPEVVAKSKVNTLTNKLDLNGDQSRTLYRAFVIHEVNYRKIVEDKNSSKEMIASEKKKIDAVLNETIKKTLTKEQYSNWLSLQKK